VPAKIGRIRIRELSPPRRGRDGISQGVETAAVNGFGKVKNTRFHSLMPTSGNEPQNFRDSFPFQLGLAR